MSGGCCRCRMRSPRCVPLSSTTPKERLSTSRGAASCYRLAQSCTRWQARIARTSATKVYSTHAKHGAHFTFLFYESRPAHHWRDLRLTIWDRFAPVRRADWQPMFSCRSGKSPLALSAAGFQARTQLEAIATVRRISEARVWSRKRNERDRRLRRRCRAISASASSPRSLPRMRALGARCRCHCDLREGSCD